ncbi:MAG TPA: substrate-binding domain-containing protein [Aggregatilineales bacterium]|nr:substrate-binding domain-containing protein [Aggregatilineales bacterium]
MHIKHAKQSLIILSLALAGCRGPIAPPTPTLEIKSLRLAADGATLPLLRDLTSNYVPTGVIIDWQIEVSEVHDMADWLKRVPYALTDYVPEVLSRDIWSTPVGQDAIAIIIPTSNTLTNLTAAQLRGVLQGRITNWTQLGGLDLPIVVVARDETSSAAMIVQSIVLGDRRTTRTARLAATDDTMVDLVGSIPGAVGYVSLSYLSNRVRALPIEGVAPSVSTMDSYPIRAPILFVGASEPGDNAYRAFFSWVQSPAGQKIVRRHTGGLPGQ